MWNKIPNIFLIFTLLGPLASAAQDEEVVLDSVVSIIEAPPVEVLDDTITFDLAGEPVPVAVRSFSQKALDSLKADEHYWYANLDPVKKKETENVSKSNRTIFDQAWFRDLLWVLILGSFIVVVFWYLVSSNILIFRKRAKSIATEEEETAVTDDIFSINYDREIDKAVSARNYRLAVRLWYLRTLRELSDKGKIDYRYGRTNHDYVMQLHKTPYYRDFFRLTRNFEYTWYGQFDLSADVYELMRNDFTTFQTSLR